MTHHQDPTGTPTASDDPRTPAREGEVPGPGAIDLRLGDVGDRDAAAASSSATTDPATDRQAGRDAAEGDAQIDEPLDLGAPERLPHMP